MGKMYMHIQYRPFKGTYLSNPRIFTGTPGKFVDLETTINDFEQVLLGNCDDIPEAGSVLALESFTVLEMNPMIL